MTTDAMQESRLPSAVDWERFPGVQANARGTCVPQQPIGRNVAELVNLDLLRATAVALVLASHVLEVFGWKKSATMHNWGINYLGSFGVLMFFIHTSLVLMRSMDRLVEAGGNVTLRFYIRRLFRIYPLSVLVVAAVLILRIPAYFEPHFQWPGLGQLLANLLLVQNVIRPGTDWTSVTTSVTGPLWSLPFEVQMYLMLPLLYWLATRITSFMGAVGLMCIGFGAMFGELRLAHALGYPPLLTYAPWFFMGVCAYTVLKRSRQPLDSRWYVIALLLFVTLPCLGYRLLLDYRSGWVNWGIGFAFAMLLPHFREIRSIAVKTAAHTVATYSYGIYLSHVPILWFAFQRLHNQPLWIQMSICLGLLITLPVILYRCVERPMIRFGARVARSLAPEKRLSVSRQ